MTSGARAAVAMVCLVWGCAGGGSSPDGKRARHPDGAEHAASQPRRDRPVTRARSERSDTAVSVSLSAPNSSGIDHQVRTLEEAIALYEQFIQRAAGQPEMKEAVRRSRERIEDARETIRFLLQGTAPELE